MRARLSFRGCALAGVALGCAASLAVTWAGGGSLAVQAAVIAAGIAAFLVLTFAGRLARGRDVLVSYHHSLAIVLAAALASAALGAPVREHLDATAVGLAVLLAVGRLGCFAAGCCHGRPAGWGPAYGAEHVPPHLAGVALLPVPLLESAALFALAAAGLALGAPLLVVAGGYAVARFGLELLRGDLRPYLGGLSEAQWTSLAVAVAVALLAGRAWVTLLVAVLLAAAVVVSRRPRGLLDPRHVAELARSVAHPPLAAHPTPGGARAAEGAAHAPLAAHTARGVARTSLGVRLTTGVIDGRAHFALSADGRSLERAEAAALGHVLLTSAGATGGELVPGAAGVWHVIAR